MLNQWSDQSGIDQAGIEGACMGNFDGVNAKCNSGMGEMMNRLPMLFQGFGLGGDGNQCTAMNRFTLNMFEMGPGFPTHTNMWLCLLYCACSLPVFLALFYVGVYRTTRNNFKQGKRPE